VQRGSRGHRGDDILAAAQNEFLQHGYKRTSIDTLAQAAGVAKGTVYLYFKSKDEVFRAVSQKVIDFFLLAAKDAAEQEGTAAERLTHVLLAKFGTVHGLAGESAHGRELIESSNTVSADLYREGDERYVDVLEALLKEQKVSKARQAAWMIFRAAQGQAETQRRVVPTAELRKRLGELAEVMLKGLT
jgi:AcrR family transcriptional regulator